MMVMMMVGMRTAGQRHLRPSGDHPSCALLYSGDLGRDDALGLIHFGADGANDTESTVVLLHGSNTAPRRTDTQFIDESRRPAF